MSDQFDQFKDTFIDGGDWGDIGGYASVISPDWTGGGNYAPINYTPPSSSYTPINPSAGMGDTGAQDLNARVIREQYKDYARRFQPIEDLAVGLITEHGTKDLPLDLARTRQTVGGVFDNMQGQQTRAMGRFGQTNKARSITGGIGQAGATVAGLNTATFADEERRMKLIGGGSTTAGTVVRGGDNGGG